MTDLDVLRGQYEEGSPGAEGWKQSDLGTLMRSADLEIHADTMFQAGATNISVDVKYGTADTPTPARIMDKPGGSIIVTVPTPDDAGTPITIVGHATVDGKPLDSHLEVKTLKVGGDARVDLCVPAVALRPRLRSSPTARAPPTVDVVVDQVCRHQGPAPSGAARRLRDPPRRRYQPDDRGNRSAPPVDAPTPTATRR